MTREEERQMERKLHAQRDGESFVTFLMLILLIVVWGSFIYWVEKSKEEKGSDKSSDNQSVSKH